MTRLELDDETLEHLKNILIWAALYDCTRNEDRNRAIYDKVLPAIGIELAGLIHSVRQRMRHADGQEHGDTIGRSTT
jgi:hypothetical protein